MEWLKKKKEEAKQAAAKLQNKRTAFKGEGNVLGGESAQSAAPPDVSSANGKGFKVPFVKQAPPPVSDEEKARRREMQTKAAESRVNAWDKRVQTARNVRLQQEEELEKKFGLPPPPSSQSEASSPQANREPVSVLSNDEVKRREMENAQAQLGFNPYAPMFSSSSEVGAATNAIGGSASPRSTSVAPPPAAFSAAPSSNPSASSGASSTENGAVYVLLRQDPTRAITAAETIIKMLNNILQNPQEDKFRRVRLANATIQTKLVNVPGAVDILREAGFSESHENGESVLVLPSDQFDASRVHSAVDRTEVALMQLRVDSLGV